MTPSTQWLPMCAPVIINGKEVNGSPVFRPVEMTLLCFLALTAYKHTRMHDVDIAREFFTADLQPDEIRN